MNTTRHWILEYGSVLILGVVPILYFGHTWFLPHVTSKTFVFYAAVEIVFACWVYTAVIDPSYRLSKKALYWYLPFMLYLGWLTIAALAGTRPEISFWSSLGRGTGLITLYHVAALACVVTSLVHQRGVEYVKKLLTWFVAGGSVIAISVWLGNEGFNLPYEFLQKSKGGGLVGNSSLAAPYLLFVAFFGAILWLMPRISRAQKTWIGISILLCLCSPLFVNFFGTGSGVVGTARASVLGFFVGGACAIGAYLALSKQKALKIVGVSALCLCMVGGVVAWKSLVTPGTVLHQKFTHVALGTRFTFWDIAHQAIAARPLLGWGPGNYMVAYQQYFDPHLYLESTSVEVWNDRAHNVFLDVGVAGGWPAVILYVVFLLSIIYGIYKSFANGALSRSQAVLLVWLLSAYVTTNVFAFDSLLFLFGLLALIAVVYGLATPATTAPQPRGYQKPWARTLIAGTLVLATSYANWIFFWRPVHKLRALAHVVELPLTTRADQYQTLLGDSPVGDGWEIGGIADDAYNLYAANQEKIKSDPRLLGYATRDLEKLLAYLEIVARKEPYDYRLALSMARLYTIEGYLSDEQKNAPFIKSILAIEDHAEQLSPSDPQVSWARAQTLVLAGDYTGAQAALQSAIVQAPYVPEGHQLLIEFAKKTKNQTLYKQAVAQAKSLLPASFETIPSF